MKTRSLFILALFIHISYGLFATVLTVSNNPNSPGQYTSLQAAIDAAGVNGDTIMVAGSATNYGSVTINKRLVLVGAGYKNPSGSNTAVSGMTFSRANDYVTSSGSKIMGFYFASGSLVLSSTGEMNNILIERCLFDAGIVGFYGSGNYNNDTIRNCVFYGFGQYTAGIHLGSSAIKNNVHIHNNVFSYAQIYQATNASSVFVRNNIFVNRTSGVFSAMNNLVIENNIFYGAYPTGCTGCAFTKNIGYLCPDMPGTGNIGSGNLNNTDPQFVNYPLLGGAFSWSHDYHLQATSPGINAGTDGSDIGIYGGMLPYELGANPRFPQMMTLTLPNGSSVPAGGTLNVHFTARKQN